MDQTRKRPPLFYLQEWLPVGSGPEELSLSGEEARHALSARRLRDGDLVQITNGKGALGEAVIQSVSQRPAALILRVERVEYQPVPSTMILLAAALPKGDRQATMLDMAAQAGMQAFVPLDCDHSAVKFQLKMSARWERILQSACKQSRRVLLPEIRQPMSVGALLDSARDDTVILYGDQNGCSLSALPDGIIHPLSSIWVAVGPEGGFSQKEKELLADHQQAHPVSAGPNILRTETAAIVMLALAIQLASANRLAP